MQSESEQPSNYSNLPAVKGQLVPCSFADLNLIGQSTLFRQVLQLIEKISQCEAPALILGETGTGKEMAARAIHYLGNRREFPFIPVNCGAIPDNLVENEGICINSPLVLRKAIRGEPGASTSKRF